MRVSGYLVSTCQKSYEHFNTPIPILHSNRKRKDHRNQHTDDVPGEGHRHAMTGMGDIRIVGP